MPRDAIQPGFLPISLFVVLRATDLVVDVGRSEPAADEHTGKRRTTLPQQLWLARLWLDSLSAATVPIVYLSARLLAGPAAGLLAGALLAFNPLAIAAANYVKEDTPVTLWLAATCLATLHLQGRRTGAAALLAGATAGLAGGAKYVGLRGCVLVLLPLALPAREARHGGEASAIGSGSAGARAPRTSRLLVLAIVGFAVTLLASTPAYVLDPAAAIRGLAFQARYAVTGRHDGTSVPVTETAGLLYLRSALLPSLGLPALFAALAGLLTLARDDRRSALLLAVATFAFLLIIEILPAKPHPFFPRYALPVVPGLCVLAAVGCVWIAGRARFAHSATTRLAAVAAVVLAWPGAQTLRFLASMYPDTRTEAAAWIAQHVPEGSWVLSTPYGPPLLPGRFRSWVLNGGAGGARLLRSVRSNAVVVTSDLFTRRFRETPRTHRRRRGSSPRSRPRARSWRASHARARGSGSTTPSSPCAGPCLDKATALVYRSRMMARPASRATPILVALVTLLALLPAGCGGDDCAGFISVNATPAQCERLAEEFGCASFDAQGDNCGLTACARCEGL